MSDELNFQLPPKGFNSYLDGIIPDDQAVLAGAFATSMQQISNVDTVDVQQLAQIVYSIENMAGLPFTNGTDIPTDLLLATFAKSQTSLGSGVYGTFTNSNFFGCMSGLPYPLKPIYDSIKKLETDKLKIIYQQLYWAVTAAQATGTVQRTLTAIPQPSPSTDYDYYFQITGVTLTSFGGGYGRGGAPAPSVTISGGSGATATCTIDTNPNNVPGTFGQVLTLVLTSAGSNSFYGSGSDPTPPDPNLTLTFESPPDQILSYPYTAGGSNVISINWSTLNNYITNTIVADANNEILAIKNASSSNFKAANVLDAYWNITGTALKQEQRARYNFMPPVPIPYDRWLTVAPVALYVFVDSVPDLAKKTLPHMAAQTLEHISNLKNTGGQSIVGMMRQERNQDRLNRIGIELYNNIPDALSQQQQKMLLTNGTLPGATDGIPSLAGKFYTLPAWPTVDLPVSGNPCDGDVLTEPTTPIPVSTFDVNTQSLRQILNTTEGNISAILDNSCLGPYRDGTGPAVIINGRLLPGLPPPVPPCGEFPEEINAEFDIFPCVDQNGLIPTVIVNPLVPTTSIPTTNVPTSGIPSSDIPTLGIPTSDAPVLDIAPPAVLTLPPNLNTAYTGTTLIPSTYDIPEAIDKVIECNCDCWIN